jgi:hypothetical protein
MGIIVEEFVQRLISRIGTDVEITLEISATRLAGFDNAIVLTINENSRTLKFKIAGLRSRRKQEDCSYPLSDRVDEMLPL